MSLIHFKKMKRSVDAPCAHDGNAASSAESCHPSDAPSTTTCVVGRDRALPTFVPAGARDSSMVPFNIPLLVSSMMDVEASDCTSSPCCLNSLPGAARTSSRNPRRLPLYLDGKPITTYGRALVAEDRSPDDAREICMRVTIRNGVRVDMDLMEEEERYGRRNAMARPLPAPKEILWGCVEDQGNQPYSVYDVAAKPLTPPVEIKPGELQRRGNFSDDEMCVDDPREKTPDHLQVTGAMAEREVTGWMKPGKVTPSCVKAGERESSMVVSTTSPSRSPPAQPKNKMRLPAVVWSPIAEQQVPQEALPADEATKYKTSALDAKIARNERALSRLRPRWWRPREEGSYTRIMKLRPASVQPSITETTRVSGAFLLEPLMLGPMTIPKGAQLVQVGDISTRGMAYNDVRETALAAGAGTELVFE